MFTRQLIERRGAAAKAWQSPIEFGGTHTNYEATLPGGSGATLTRLVRRTKRTAATTSNIDCRLAADPVLHVITDLDSGGAEHMLTRLVLASHKSARHVVISLLDDGCYASTLRNAGVDVHSLGLDRFSRLPAALIRLVLLMRRIRPAIVMTWLYHADVLGTLAAIVSGVGAKRVVWNLRCSNIDFSQYGKTSFWIVKLLTRLSPLPMVVTTNSRAGLRAHRALGYRPRHWALLPNGLDPDEYRPSETDRINVRNELGLDHTEFVVGVIARVDPQKDHATFLAAAEIVAAKYSHVRFVLIGRNTTCLTACKCVLTLGERRDIPRLLRGLDLIVLSSAFGEGSPNVLAEAMATGTPCVTTDVGDAAALVEHSGLAVPPRDAEALATAIISVLLETPAARAARGQRSRQTIQRNHNIEGTMEAYRQLCQFVMRQDHCAPRSESIAARTPAPIFATGPDSC